MTIRAFPLVQMSLIFVGMKEAYFLSRFIVHQTRLTDLFTMKTLYGLHGHDLHVVLHVFFLVVIFVFSEIYLTVKMI